MHQLQLLLISALAQFCQTLGQSCMSTFQLTEPAEWQLESTHDNVSLGKDVIHLSSSSCGSSFLLSLLALLLLALSAILLLTLADLSLLSLSVALQYHSTTCCV